MSTPVIERPETPGRTRPRPQTRTTAAPPRIPAQRGPAGPARSTEQRRRGSARDHTGRAKFVLVVMVLLVAGLVATLWLSTAAAADSYRLQDARQRTSGLAEQSEALRKEVTVLQSPGSLADRATAQGMVAIADPARLVVAPDGRVDVVGEPQAAVAPPPPPPAPGTEPAQNPQNPQQGQATTPGGTSDPDATGGDAAAAAGAQAGGAQADGAQNGTARSDGAQANGGQGGDTTRQGSAPQNDSRSGQNQAAQNQTGQNQTAQNQNADRTGAAGRD